MHAREAEMHLASRFMDFVADDERKKEAGEGSGLHNEYTPLKYTLASRLYYIFFFDSLIFLKVLFLLILKLIN